MSIHENQTEADTNAIYDKMLIPGQQGYITWPHMNKWRPVLSLRFLSKNHVQTAHEFHDFNIDFIVWTRLLVHSSMAPHGFESRYLPQKSK